MSPTGTPFDHSTPALYDRLMGSLLFEPYAKLVAERTALLQPGRILETAAGTGIVTRALSEAVPQAEIVATDLNPVMLEFAGQAPRSERVEFPEGGGARAVQLCRPGGDRAGSARGRLRGRQVETVAASSQVSPRDAAQGLVLGSPFRAEIERRDPSGLEGALDAVTEAFRPWDGEDAPISAHVVTATKP